MSTKPPKRLIFRWATLKGLVAILLFLITATLIECFVVLYAKNLGVQDKTQLQESFSFPGTSWIITVSISPLFHLVPIAAVIALVSSWSYLTRHVAVTPNRKEKAKPTRKKEKKRTSKAKKLASKITDFFGRIKTELLKIKGIAYLWREIHFGRATIKSALTVLLVFGAFILLVSLLAYPQLIYLTVSDAYQNNPSLFNSVKSISNAGRRLSEALAPVGWFCSAANDALLSFAPGFRDFILNLGSVIKPLVDLNPTGKYLVFQNVATWISALSALIYGEYKRRSHRYRRR